MRHDINRRLCGFASAHNRRGATAVEFAVGVIVLFIFLFGALEVGRIYLIRHAADNAAYEAARHTMVPGGTREEAVLFAEDMLSAAGVRDGQIVVTPDVITDSTEQVSVDISIPLDTNGWLTPQFAKGRMIFASSTLRTERSSGMQIDSNASSSASSPEDDSAEAEEAFEDLLAGGAPPEPAPEPAPEDPPSSGPPPAPESPPEEPVI